jgi:RNA polymerase sigma factor (sigma-70 family)
MKGDSTLPEFQLSMRVKNNRLIKLRQLEELSQGAFCDKYGLSLSSYVSLETLRESPITKAGEWREIARRLAEVHGVALEWLFPPEVLAIREPARDLEIDGERMLQLAGQTADSDPLQLAEKNEQVEAALDALEDLAPSIRSVVRGVFLEGMTYADVGAQMQLSRERVRQVAESGIGKIRKRLLRVGFGGSKAFLVFADGKPVWVDEPPYEAPGSRRCFVCDQVRLASDFERPGLAPGRCKLCRPRPGPNERAR